MPLRRSVVLAVALALAVPLGLGAVPAASAAEGDLDAAFSGDGVLPLEWSFGPVANTRDIASGPGGSVYLAGDNGAQACLTRVTAAGVLDTTFAATAPGSWCNTVNGAMLALASSSTGEAVGAFLPNGTDREVVRLRADGSLRYRAPLAGTGTIFDVAALDDGRSLLLDTTATNVPGRVTLMSASGAASPAWTVPQPAGRTFLPTQLVLGPVGTLLLAGPSTDGASDVRMTVAKVTLAGAPVTAFGGDGFVDGPATGFEGGAAALLPDGDVVVGALSAGTMALDRFSGTGTPVVPFGTAGRRSDPAPATTDFLADLVARPDGRFYLVYGRFLATPAATLVTERRRADGSRDTLFGGDGIATYSTGAYAAGSNHRGIEAQGALGPKGDLYTRAQNYYGAGELVRFDGSENAAPTGFTVSRPASPWTLTRTLPLRFTGTDVSGVQFEIRTARGSAASGLGAYGAARTTTARSRTETVDANETVCVSVRAADVWGNRTAAAPARCVAAPIPARSLGKRGFSLVGGRRTYASTVLTTTRSGATASTATLKVRQLALVVSTCPTCGAATVSFRGRILTVVDLRGRARTRVVLPVATFPQTRVGAVTVRVITSGKRVTIEGVGALAGPAPFVTR